MNRRPEIQKVLRQLRWWIRRYVLIEGVAATVALVCLLFWLSFGADLLYFQFSQLELPHWFRVLAIVGMGGLIVAGVMTWLGLRLFRRFSAADLALALERRFPELNDRLITAVELQRESGSEFQNSMLRRTTDEAVERIRHLPVKQTFNPQPLWRALTAAAVLLVSILVLGLADARGMERWYNAYILQKDDYWEPFRQQNLELQVVAQPGDRVRRFNDQHVYRHPRGADLHLQVAVAEGTPAPQNVSLRFLTDVGRGQQRGRVTMSPSSDGLFHHTLARVMTNQDLWIRGGDFVNRDPYRIEVVDPPRVDSLELQCDYPSYTGMDGQEDRRVPVVGTQVSLPMETQFDLHAKVNKPLLRVHLRSERFELSFGYQEVGEARTQIPTRLTLIDPETQSSRVLELATAGATLFNAERTAFRVPLKVTWTGAGQLAALTPEDAFPIPLPPETMLQIFLEDEDQIYSPDPTAVTINGIVDQPPTVESRRIGIGPAVTRMANIPLEGKLTDDYGVVEAWFNYRVDQAPDPDRRDLANPPTGQKEFPLRQSQERPVETFNLIPLQLEEGQSLTLSISARDGDNLNGPHVSQGEVFTFKIISKEELLGRLNDREVTLRQRFEQIRSELADLKSLLTTSRERVTELDAGRPTAQSTQAIIAALADRGLHQVRKNQTESRSIEVSFRDLRDEMVNNRAETAELLERIERRVIEPLSLVNTGPFLEVDRRLGVFRLAVDRQSGILQSADDVQPALDELLAGIDAILAEMKERGSYNEMIQNLQKMIEAQKQLLEQTEDKRIEENFFTPLN